MCIFINIQQQIIKKLFENLQLKYLFIKERIC